MMYSYLVFDDETEVVHSQIKEIDGVESVEVHFEKPTDKGFSSARCVLPSYKWLFNEGFDSDKIQFFEEFLRCNAHLIYKYARLGGINCA